MLCVLLFITSIVCFLLTSNLPFVLSLSLPLPRHDVRPIPYFYSQMIDFTESTLDSVLSTTDLVRAVRLSLSIFLSSYLSQDTQKLAEHRAAREREQQRISEQEEARRRNPPRLV